jgi:hypothetical protein
MPEQNSYTIGQAMHHLACLVFCLAIRERAPGFQNNGHLNMGLLRSPDTRLCGIPPYAKVCGISEPPFPVGSSVWLKRAQHGAPGTSYEAGCGQSIFEVAGPLPPSTLPRWCAGDGRRESGSLMNGKAKGARNDGRGIQPSRPRMPGRDLQPLVARSAARS